MDVKRKGPFYEDPKQLYEKVKGALEYYELSDKITLPILQKWINESDSPIYFISKVLDKARVESETDIEKLLDLLTRLWNATPRREFGGISPQDKFASGSFDYIDEEA